MDASNRIALVARRLLRRLPPFHRLAVWVVSAAQGGYEEHFIAALEEELRPGDCLWDIGANVGEYSARLAPIVGETGAIIAIEPSPACVGVLDALAARCHNIEVRTLAVSDFDGNAFFSIADGPTAVSNKIIGEGVDAIAVQVARGDTLVETGTRFPNVVKVDVEGFEQEVLRGLSRTLLNPDLRAVFLEMHFNQLDDRGFPKAPSAITRDLRAAGFKIQWADFSHLIASRKTPDY